MKFQKTLNFHSPLSKCAQYCPQRASSATHYSTIDHARVPPTTVNTFSATMSVPIQHDPNQQAHVCNLCCVSPPSPITYQCWLWARHRCCSMHCKEKIKRSKSRINKRRRRKAAQKSNQVALRVACTREILLSLHSWCVYTWKIFQVCLSAQQREREKFAEMRKISWMRVIWGEERDEVEMSGNSQWDFLDRGRRRKKYFHSSLHEKSLCSSSSGRKPQFLQSSGIKCKTH